MERSEPRCGMVSLVGRTNAGKSTLMNSILGEKVAIVSSRPQTTRNRILGIWNGAFGQVAFVDTPGIHRPIHELNRRMVTVAMRSLYGIDAVVVVVDVAIPFGNGDRFILERLKEVEVPIILALNKIDRVKKLDLLPRIELYDKAHKFKSIVPISALKKKGLDELTSSIIECLPQAPPRFPIDRVTEQPDQFFAAELVRESLLRHVREEIPYTSAVLVEPWEEKKGSALVIRGTILVEKESQKAILIGKAGSMIKKIGIDARQQMEKVFDHHVHLDLKVRVEKNWREQTRFLKRLGVGTDR